jgi:2-haloacid dehalogenase
MSSSPLTEPAAIVFDVFGTVVDWRSSVIAAGGGLIGGDIDWPAFADRWRREGYLQPIRRIVTGTQQWEPVDVVMRRRLEHLAEEFGFDGVGREKLDELAGVWSRLDPWPDVTEGLARLKARYPIGPLSNGSFGGLTRMARHGGLGWDFIISTELFGTYKPDPRAYSGAAGLLGVAPEDLMLVAAHPADLQAAARCGLSTAYVARPLEWGDPEPAPVNTSGFDLEAGNFSELAEALGA